MFDLQKFFITGTDTSYPRAGGTQRLRSWPAPLSSIAEPVSFRPPGSLLSSFLRLESKPCASPSCAARSIPVANSPNATFVLDTNAYVVAPSMKTPTQANPSIRFVCARAQKSLCTVWLLRGRFGGCSARIAIPPCILAAVAPKHEPRKNPGVMSSAHSFGIGFRASLYRSRDSIGRHRVPVLLDARNVGRTTTPTTFFTRAPPRLDATSG